MRPSYRELTWEMFAVQSRLFHQFQSENLFPRTCQALVGKREYRPHLHAELADASVTNA